MSERVMGLFFDLFQKSGIDSPLKAARRPARCSVTGVSPYVAISRRRQLYTSTAFI
jgi:hypothetical protein